MSVGWWVQWKVHLSIIWTEPSERIEKEKIQVRMPGVESEG